MKAAERARRAVALQRAQGLLDGDIRMRVLAKFMGVALDEAGRLQVVDAARRMLAEEGVPAWVGVRMEVSPRRGQSGMATLVATAADR